MKFFPCICLLFFGVIVISCSKETLAELGYPSIFHKSGFRLNGSLRVFASTGEVIDKDVISRFNESDSSQLNYQTNYVVSYPGAWDSVTFSDPGHAIMNSLQCRVDRDGKNYILTRLDTTLSVTYMEEYSHNIAYFIGQIKPIIYSESLSSSTRGEYLFPYSATQKFLLSKTGDKLVAPLIVFKLYSSYANGLGSYTSYVNNILQDDFFKSMNQGDTVVLNEYVITYAQ